MEPQDPKLTEETRAEEVDLLRADVEKRAYQLYEARGRVDGFDLEDWLQAEQEILGAPEPVSKAAAGS